MAKDPARGVALLEAACGNGDASACLRLGARYRDGNGVPPSPFRALDYFQRGCDRMRPAACTAAAELLDGGKGVAAEPARAAELRRRGCQLGAAACADPARLDKVCFIHYT